MRRLLVMLLTLGILGMAAWFALNPERARETVGQAVREVKERALGLTSKGQGFIGSGEGLDDAAKKLKEKGAN